MRHLLIFGILLVASINISGQQDFLQFKQLTAENGLSKSQITCILQDYKGFMWIGTMDGGLNRYDGKNIVIYKNDPFDSTSLAGNIAKWIYEDYKKNLFIGTYNGLSLYNRDLDCFINFTNDKNSALYGMDIAIYRITGDAFGNLWMSTTSGLICFDYYKNKITQYRHNPNDAKSIKTDQIENTFFDSKNRIWVSTRSGLHLLDIKTGNFKPITQCSSHHDKIDEIYFRTAVEDATGNVWFGSNNGLFYLDKNCPTDAPELTHYLHNPDDPTSLSHNYVISLFIDDEQNFWIGTENGGINLFHKDKKIFSHIGIEDFNMKSLNSESIWCMTQDRNKILWIGTFGGWINMLVKDSDWILHYKNLPGVPQSLGHNVVNDFLEDTKGRIWVVTDGGGLNLFDDKKGQFTRYNTSNSNLNTNVILCLLEGSNDQLWMGTWLEGLVNFDIRSNTFKSYNLNNSAIADDKIHAIAIDKKGNLWLGSQHGGLINYIPNENRFVNYNPENSELSNQRVAAISIDQKGHLYLASTTSFQIYIPEENRFITYSNNPEDSNTISNSFVNDILIENDSSVWVGTSFGLNQFNPITQKFKKFYEKDGLANNFVEGLTFDKGGDLWITTDNGISRFNIKSSTFKNYIKSDGLLGNEFNDKCILTTKNGTILVGGKNGFNSIKPWKIPENKKIPDIIISGLNIFNQPARVGAEGSPLKKQISETQEITLNYKQSVITLFFTVLDYTNTQKNQYAYKLENFDLDWNYSGNKSEATYTNLNPGKYIFRVKGSNNDGVWNETGASLIITITPPWWKTIIFRILFILFIIAAATAFYFRRITVLKENQAELEKKVAERTQELSEVNVSLEEQQEELNIQNEELSRHRNNLEGLVNERTLELEKAKRKAEESDSLKSSFLANMSHEIRTPMNAIVGFSNLLNQSDLTDEIKENYITQINSNSGSLLTLIDDILDISMMEANLLAITKKEFELNLLLDEVFLDCSVQNSKSEIRLSNHVEDSNIILETDRFRLKQILINLFNNACKFTENGFVELGCLLKDNQLVLYVKDTGIGISSENLKIIFDRFSKVTDEKTKLFRGVGLGLSISKKIAELLGGVLTGESELGVGSTFSLSLPTDLIVKTKVIKQSMKQLNPLNWEHKNILVVEDEETNYSYLESALRPTKAKIVWAQNGSQALDLFNKGDKFDAVLMDIKMPIMNGYDATVAIKALFPNQVVIAQTAYARPEEYEEIKKAGFDDYLIKPIIPNDLYSVLSKYL